jgi:transcriptional regulator with XRE-family HTH domain
MSTILSGCQLRMARAALTLTTRQLGERVGLSAMAISRYEHGDTRVISVKTMQSLVTFFTTQRVFFGPKDGVCVGQDVFAGERWLGLACYRLLQDNGVHPTSRDLLEAFARMQGEQQ